MKIVKYDNGVNKLRLGTLTEKETDLFFSLMFKYKDEGKRKLILSFEELKELSEQQRTDRLIDDLYRLLDDKLLKITIAGTGVDEKKGRYGERANIFSYYKLFEEAGELHINITEEFQAKLTGLLGNFTIFDLKELVSLKGSYPKTLFRLLKQWETTKEYIVFISEFRDLLGVLPTYRQCDIDEYILTPCLQQLKQFFPNLKVEKVKKGVKIDKLIFTWKTKVKPVKNLGSAVKIKQGLTDEEFEKYISKGTKKSKKIENPEEIQKQEKRKLTQEEYEEKYLEFLNGRKATAKEKKLFDAFFKIRFEVGE